MRLNAILDMMLPRGLHDVQVKKSYFGIISASEASNWSKVALFILTSVLTSICERFGTNSVKQKNILPTATAIAVSFILACVAGGIRERASGRASIFPPWRSPRGNSRATKPRVKQQKPSRAKSRQLRRLLLFILALFRGFSPEKLSFSNSNSIRREDPTENQHR